MAVEETCEEMKASLFLAYRELEKAKLRNFLIVLSVAVGVMGVILVDSMQSGFIDDFKVKTIDIFTSHLQVLPDEEDDFVLRAESKRRIIDNISGVRGTALRIESKALIAAEGRSKQVRIMAIEPEREPDVTSLDKKIVEGQFLLASDRTRVVLGKRLAEDVRVGIGETVTIVFPNGTGRQFKVGGLLDSGFYDFDSGVVLVSYATLTEIEAKENIATSIVVRVQDEGDVDAIALQINQLTPQDRVETWMQLSPFVQLILQTQSYRTMMSVTLILITAGFSMISAMVIKVSARTRYIGMTKAMGATGGFILGTYLMQAAVIGVLGGFLGDALAFLGYSFFSTRMIVVPGLEQTLGSSVLPFHLNPSMYLKSFIFALAVCVLSALYPAYRASRLEVMETVRHA